MADENVHAGHRERMRKKFNRNGFKGWEAHEVLEYILYYSIPRGNTNPTAHRVIKKCGGFTKVFNAPDEILLDVEDLGKKSVSLLRMLGEFVKYYNDARFVKSGRELNSDTCEPYLLNLFHGKNYECLYMICLDARSRIIYEEMLSDGGVDSIEANITKIVRTAVRSEAPYVVLAHNHPSEVAKASQADIISTNTIERALRLSGAELIDHIIVAGGKCHSMLNAGELLRSKETVNKPV